MSVPARVLPVFITQLRTLGAPRGSVFLALLLLACYTVSSLGIISFEMAGAPSVFRCYPLLLVAAASWAVAVWRDEGPAGRDYFWALPIARWLHALIRTAAGGAWLAIGLGALAALGAAFDGAATLPSQATPLAWLSLFSGPLTIYIVVSAAAVLSRHPGKWTIGVLIGWASLQRACQPGVPCGPRFAGRAAIAELFGLIPAVTGVMRDEFVAGRAAPAEAPWLMAGWLLIGVATVALAARRPPAI